DLLRPILLEIDNLPRTAPIRSLAFLITTRRAECAIRIEAKLVGDKASSWRVLLGPMSSISTQELADYQTTHLHHLLNGNPDVLPHVRSSPARLSVEYC